MSPFPSYFLHPTPSLDSAPLSLQSHAGLAGSDDVENAQIAAAVDSVDGILTEVVKFFFEKDEEKKVATGRVVGYAMLVLLMQTVSLVFWCRLL